MAKIAKNQLNDDTAEIIADNNGLGIQIPGETDFRESNLEKTKSRSTKNGKSTVNKSTVADSSPNVLLILCDKKSKEVSNSLYSIPRKCKTDVYSGSEILRLSVMAKRKNRLSVQATFNSAGIDEKSFVIIESPKVYTKLLELIPSMKLYICFIDEFDHEKMKQTLSGLGLVVTGTEVFSTSSKLVGVTIPSIINYLTGKFII